MINTSGGMTGGDKIDWSFSVAENACLTLTTQAFERVYKSSGGLACTNIHLELQAGAKLAWLPQETILFDQSAYSRTINVDTTSGADLLMVESVVFGRAAMGETIKTLTFFDQWRVHVDGELHHAESTKLAGEAAGILGNSFATDGASAMATILFVSRRAEGLQDPVRSLLSNSDAASAWKGKLVVRMLAKDDYVLRQRLIPIINLLHHPDPLPKIWTS